MNCSDRPHLGHSGRSGSEPPTAAMGRSADAGPEVGLNDPLALQNMAAPNRQFSSFRVRRDPKYRFLTHSGCCVVRTRPSHDGHADGVEIVALGSVMQKLCVLPTPILLRLFAWHLCDKRQSRAAGKSLHYNAVLCLMIR